MERERGWAKQVAGIINDPHGHERNRPTFEQRIDAERLQKADGAVEQGDSASVPARIRGSDKAGSEAISGECEGRSEASRTRSHDEDVERPVVGHVRDRDFTQLRRAYLKLLVKRFSTRL